MSKMLIFDMDGTIADLYGVADWLPRLRAEDTTPYAEAEPMYNMETLKVILNIMKDMGYRVSVVSWGAMNGTNEYTKAVKKVKREWLQKHEFPYDELHVVKYGTPKQYFAKADTNILIDDNLDVRTSFMRSNPETKFVIDATENIIKSLIDLIVAA